MFSVSFRLSDLIDKIKHKFGDAKVIISSILPRKDKHKEVTSLNEYLLNLCDTTRQVKFMENLEISSDMLRNQKHLNDTGF